MEGKPNVLDVPTVESRGALAEDLRRFGFGHVRGQSLSRVDVRKLRDRLGLTQEQFALRFGLELDAVQELGIRPARAGCRREELPDGHRKRPGGGAGGPRGSGEVNGTPEC